jgi:hypothetical protein
MKKLYNAFLIALIAQLLITTEVIARSSAHASSLYFTENKGQITDQLHNYRNDIQFGMSAGNGLNIFIGAGAIHYQFSKANNAAAQPTAKGNDPRSQRSLDPQEYTMYRMDIKLEGANPNATLIKEKQLPYFEHWYTPGTGNEGVVTNCYERITYSNIYPNIDWVIYADGGTMKHEFVVRPGGDASMINIQYDGSSKLELGSNGSLTATTPLGTIHEDAPYSYTNDGKEVSSSFVVNGNRVRYNMALYSGTLTIDPAIAWATYYGSVDDENACSVFTDINGSVYMAGNTRSVSSIATTGAFLSTFAGAMDGLLVKFSGTGTRLWATYYGGIATESGDAVATDLAGNVYVAGVTNSATGIATAGVFLSAAGGSSDGYLAKFDSTGSRLWATYYGTDSLDDVCTNGLTTDVSGNVFITGSTSSITSVFSVGAWQAVNNGGTDCYLAKFDNAGNRLWATFYGGTGYDLPTGVATDLSGNVYLSGYTSSASSIASAGAFMTTYGGATDAFLAKFDNSGNRLWGTYYGDASLDYGEAVRTDISGNVYLTGRTLSTSGIASAGAYQVTNAGGADAYLAKFDNSGNRLWATYYGGNNGDYAVCLTTDATGNIYLSGWTGSTTGIATPGAFQTVAGGGYDAFLAQFSPSGSRMWATYYGDTAFDQAFSLSSDGTGGVYMTGLTKSPSATLVTTGAHQTVFGGGTTDAFLAKFNFATTGLAATFHTGKLTINPNPGTGNFSVLIDNPTAEVVSIVITDLAGRTVKELTTTSNKATDITLNQPPGIYFVAATIKQERYFVKLVVQ